MAVVQTWDGVARRVYLLPDVTEFHPVEDIYKEYRTERRTNEDLRKFNPLMAAYGNVTKGGGRSTPRYLVLLEDTKIVPYDTPTRIVSTGEMITDDPDVDPTTFDLSDRTGSIKLFITPAEAEIIYIEGSGTLTAKSIAVAVLDEPVNDHRDEGTLGSFIRKIFWRSK